MGAYHLFQTKKGRIIGGQNFKIPAIVSTQCKHYHLQVEPNPPKNCTIKPMLFSVSMGKMGLTHEFFFNQTEFIFIFQNISIHVF